MKIFTKGDKLKKVLHDVLAQNKTLVESHDIRWRDFGKRFRSKLRRDGSVISDIMSENTGKEELIDITSQNEVKRVIRKIDELIKQSQKTKKELKLRAPGSSGGEDESREGSPGKQALRPPRPL